MGLKQDEFGLAQACRYGILLIHDSLLQGGTVRRRAMKCGVANEHNSYDIYLPGAVL